MSNAKLYTKKYGNSNTQGPQHTEVIPTREIPLNFQSKRSPPSKSHRLINEVLPLVVMNLVALIYNGVDEPSLYCKVQ